MKQLLFLLLIFFAMSFLFAEMNIENNDEHISVEMNFAEQSKEISKIFAIPSKNIEVQIISTEVEKYSLEGDLIETKISIDLPFIKSVDNFIMRDLCAHKITIQKEFKIDNYVYFLKEIHFEILPDGSIDIPTQISSVFVPLYEKIVCNFDKSYLRDIPLAPARMVVITKAILVQYLSDFLAWKNAKGIMTDVFTLTQTGDTNSQIKIFLQNLYDDSQTRPDYILIIGDVDDSYAVPSFYFGDENNVSDNSYTLLSGADYFPDALIGRISIDSSQKLATIINKIFKYEKEPYMTDTDWFTSALLVAGNYSSTLPIPTTPVKVTRWLSDKMTNYGFDNVTQVYYPPTYPGTPNIISALNNGVSFASYRGWGDANGWHYPYFHTENIDELNNGFYLPVMTSIVCNTGDFANNVDPCFGEKWLRAGTPTLPKGGVVFVGPSDLHTSTKFNNAIFSGFYAGLLDEEIYTFGSAVLRGKIELYNNYPLNLESGDQVEFYFYVYNILGDPSLTMWTKVPEYINCNLPDNITSGTNFLDINVSTDLNGAVVTAMQNNTLLDIQNIENGNTILYLNNFSAGEVQVTITKANFYPYTKTISVNSQNVDVGIESAVSVSSLISGNSNEIAITLKNYGSAVASNVSATLSTSNPYVTLIDNSQNFGNINGSASIQQQYSIEIAEICPDETILEFNLEISTGSTGKFYLIANGLSLKICNTFVNDGNGILDPGDNSEINVSIQNIGSVNASNLQVEVISTCDAVTVSNNTHSLGNLNADQSAEFSFNASAAADCFVGRSARFDLNFEDGNGLITIATFVYTIGEINNTAPTGPDNYGYFCYDSFDTNYSEKPDYFWQEIDPDYSGNGEVLLMGDDVSQDVFLPFNFKYYGEDFNEITICSNGWMSFETTWMTNFRNWGIPAAIGPYGMVAAYWDDLIGAPLEDEHEDMRICYYHDNSAHTFIIEWNEAYNRFDDTSIEKFQLILYDPVYYSTIDGNGEIQFNYHTVNNPDANNNYATVGIENLNQSDGIQYTYANIYLASASTLQNEFALKFTTDPPDNYTESDETIIAPQSVILHANYPNPFNPETTISFSLSTEHTQIQSFFLTGQAENTELIIYNIKGQEIKKLKIENVKCKINSIIWNGTDEEGKPVPSGIYFYKLKYGKFTATRKMILMK